LDTWVFDKVKAFLGSAKTDKDLDTALRRNQVVFFLHLLGLDTHGHSHRPHSAEYLANIASVDRGIQEVVELLEDFYHHDQKTAYLFTADHGMNDRGAHGDGDPQNTETPLVAWGAGLAKPGEELVESVHSAKEIERTRSWNLDPLQRKDVSQADIAPLMVLSGYYFPR